MKISPSLEEINMAANLSEPRNWEYRHQSIKPDLANSSALHCQEQDPEFIRWLIETLESIENSEEGWRMVQAKIESDENGRCWLDVLMKRLLADANNPPNASSIPHAA
jgi:hypothetical protein